VRVFLGSWFLRCCAKIRFAFPCAGRRRRSEYQEVSPARFKTDFNFSEFRCSFLLIFFNSLLPDSGSLRSFSWYALYCMGVSEQARQACKNKSSQQTVDVTSKTGFCCRAQKPFFRVRVRVLFVARSRKWNCDVSRISLVLVSGSPSLFFGPSVFLRIRHYRAPEGNNTWITACNVTLKMVAESDPPKPHLFAQGQTVRPLRELLCVPFPIDRRTCCSNILDALLRTGTWKECSSTSTFDGKNDAYSTYNYVAILHSPCSFHM